MAAHYFCSIGIPCLLYIDDRHNGDISFSRVTQVYAALPSDREGAFARASSAVFIVCYTLSKLGYFIGLKKSILVPRQCSVPWFWHRLCPSSFHPSRGKKTQTHCSRGACFIFKHSGCKDLTAFRWEVHLFLICGPRRVFVYSNEVNLAISRGLRSSRQLRVAGPLLEVVQHWTFLRSWHGCLPWLKESHTQIQLASDASGVRGPFTEPVSIRDYWPLLDLGHNIAVKKPWPW